MIDQVTADSDINNAWHERNTVNRLALESVLFTEIVLWVFPFSLNDIC